MKLIYKLFFAFCVTNFVTVGLMLSLITVNLSAGFNEFVNATELKQVTELKKQMIAFYQQNGSWQILRDNEQVWKKIVGANQDHPANASSDNQSDELSVSVSGEKNEESKFIATRTLSSLLQTEKRLSLYDANKQVIVGRPLITDNPHSETIELDGEVIGWLSLIPSRLEEESPANEFLAQQFKSYYGIAFAVVMLAFITAWLFSRHLVAPISALIKGTYTLIGGNYCIRIEKTTSDELALLSDNVNVLAETLEKNQNNRSKWMSDVSHELKTPLTVLRGQLIAIQDGVFKADEQRVQLIINQIDTLSNIVGDLYQLSVTDVGGLSYKKVSVQPVQVLLQVIDSFSAKFEAQSLSLDCSSLQNLIDDKHCILLADKDRLRQLFVNLLENCCRYTQSPGSIRILVSMSEQQLEIKIEDSAPGVSPEAQSRLFERFYRVEPSRNRDFGGSGLGLALCKQIVDAHQGTIAATDSPLGGLSVIISMPIHRSYAE